MSGLILFRKEREEILTSVCIFDIASLVFWLQTHNPWLKGSVISRRIRPSLLQANFFGCTVSSTAREHRLSILPVCIVWSVWVRLRSLSNAFSSSSKSFFNLTFFSISAHIASSGVRILLQCGRTSRYRSLFRRYARIERNIWIGFLKVTASWTSLSKTAFVRNTMSFFRRTTV